MKQGKKEMSIEKSDTRTGLTYEVAHRLYEALGGKLIGIFSVRGMHSLSEPEFRIRGPYYGVPLSADDLAPTDRDYSIVCRIGLLVSSKLVVCFDARVGMDLQTAFLSGQSLFKDLPEVLTDAGSAAASDSGQEERTSYSVSYLFRVLWKQGGGIDLGELVPVGAGGDSGRHSGAEAATE